MGTPLILFADLPCPQCKNERRFDLQFRTARLPDDERYVSGEFVDDPGLPRGSVFEACLWCYCDECMRSWTADQSAVYYEALADLVKCQRIHVRRAGMILEAQNLIAESMSAAASPGGVPDFGAWLLERDLSIEPPTRPIMFEVLQDMSPERKAIEQLFDASMRRRGWRFGGEFIRCDAEVRITVEGRITHHVPDVVATV